MRRINRLELPKEALREADYSTVDGITHEILKVTIGNDEHPVTDKTQLEAVAELFNTPEKAFQVYWNHTLQIERIVAENTDQIFGKGKFEQVNADISGSFGMLRPILDGIIEGQTNSEAIKVAIKALIAKLNYARRQVAGWLEDEYKPIAEIYKFEQIPAVRFNDMALKDELQLMNLLMQMVDRRIVSYKSVQEKLNFKPEYELEQMKIEKPLVIDGTLGIKGSPYQQNAGLLQPTQQTPKGTPSGGRPKTKVAPTPKKSTPKGQLNYPTKIQPTRRKAASTEDVVGWLFDMTEEELQSLGDAIGKIMTIKSQESNEPSQVEIFDEEIK